MNIEAGRIRWEKGQALLLTIDVRPEGILPGDMESMKRQIESAAGMYIGLVCIKFTNQLSSLPDTFFLAVTAILTVGCDNGIIAVYHTGKEQFVIL